MALNWPAASKATGYNIYRASASAGSYIEIASIVSTTNYTDLATTNGCTYFYFVTAVNAYGESAGSPQAMAYLVDHFAFASIPSPQTSSVPFSVSISACDLGGNVLSNFTGAANLSAAGDHGIVSLTPTITAAFLNGQWAGTVALDAAYPDTNIRLTASSNNVSGTSNPFNAVAPAIQVFNGLLAADLAYNPFTQRLYAVAPAGAAFYSNSLVVIEPVMGRVETSYYLGDDPAHLAVSSDGQFIYIGFNGTNVFRRFNLTTRTIDLQVGLAGTTDVAAFPGLPHAVAVNNGGVAIFDDGVQRSNTYPFGGLLVAGSANELFTMGGGYPAAPFARLTVDASGVSDYTFEDGIVGFNETFKYQRRADIYLGRNSVQPGHRKRSRLPDQLFHSGARFSSGQNLLHGVASGFRPARRVDTLRVECHQLADAGKLGDPGVNDGGPTTLVRWGTNGIAFSISSWYINQFYLVRTPLVSSVPPVLTGGSRQASGSFQLNFTGDKAFPNRMGINRIWQLDPLGPPNLVSNGWFWFWDVNAANYSHRFYRAGISP